MSVKVAAQRVGITRSVWYIWQRRWNDEGYNGLIPRYKGGRPPKLTDEQKESLKEMLRERDHWTTNEVRDHILREFGVGYTIKQIRIILKKFGMKYAKPYTHDYRRPVDAEMLFKKNCQRWDETSPQTTANTQRLLSFNKPRICKNTTKLKANTFGFYALNGNSIVDFKERSKKEEVCEFLMAIRSANPEKKIIVILDNFSSHRANDTVKCADDCAIALVYLPQYSPDLNPIEYIWKSIKRILSKNLIYEKFMKYSSQLSFAKKWIKKFLDDKYMYERLGS